MHRCRAAHHGGHYPYSCHHSVPYFSPYDIIEPIPVADSHCCSSSHLYDYSHGRCLPYIDYAPRVLARPPIVQTNIQNDFCCHCDEPDGFYDDDYGNPYRLSRSKIQLVDLVPARSRGRANGSNSMVVSTFQPRQRQSAERVIVPRSTVVRHTSLPAYERPRRAKLMPLYHSAEPHYISSHRHRGPVQELIPVATMANPSYSKQQTIRVRSLSPIT